MGGVFERKPSPLELFRKFKKQRLKETLRRKREQYDADHVRYAIKYQWRNPKGPVGPEWNWASWRCFGQIPILFHTKDEAQEYLDNIDPFKNMGHLRKVSCSIERIII